MITVHWQTGGPAGSRFECQWGPRPQVPWQTLCWPARSAGAGSVETASTQKATALGGSCVQLWLKGRVHTRRPLAARALVPLPSFDVSRGATFAKPSVELLGSGEATREQGVFSEHLLQRPVSRMGGELAENANSAGPTQNG